VPELAAQIVILATMASSISILEMFNQSSGYCPGEGWFFLVKIKRDVLKILNFGVDRETINVKTCQV